MDNNNFETKAVDLKKVSYDLKKIKKVYGDRFANLCRELFPSLLDKEGLLFETLQNNIEPNKDLYDDIISYGCKEKFRDFINKCVEYDKKIEITPTDKSPQELLESVGYKLYECKTEEELKEFIKYYSYGEVLCTFDTGRLNSCYIFFIVKNNVDEIKRRDFSNPQREDDYSVSVLSIQFTHGKQSVVNIISRYNHSVFNPNATYENNLEKIVPGLTDAFIKYYGFNILGEGETMFDMPKYVFSNDGKMFKYKFRIASFNRTVYICDNNVIIDNGEVKRFNKDNYVFADNYIIDLKNKKIVDYFSDKLLLEYWHKETNEFPDETLNNISGIKLDKITENNEVITKVTFSIENGTPVEMKIKNNEIISYTNENKTTINNFFLYLNKSATNIHIPNAESVGDYFLYHNEKVDNLNIEATKIIGDYFLFHNEALTTLNLNNAKEIGWYGLTYNRILEELNLENAIKVGYSFLMRNNKYKSFRNELESKMEKLKEIENEQ